MLSMLYNSIKITLKYPLQRVLISIKYNTLTFLLTSLFGLYGRRFRRRLVVDFSSFDSIPDRWDILPNLTQLPEFFKKFLEELGQEPSCRQTRRVYNIV